MPRFVVVWLVVIGALTAVAIALMARRVWKAFHPEARPIAVTGCEESYVQAFTQWPDPGWRYVLQCRVTGESPLPAPSCDEVRDALVADHGSLDGDVRVLVFRASTLVCTKTYAVAPASR